MAATIVSDALENKLSRNLGITRKALVVGINEYNSKLFGRLQGAIPDAQEIAAILREQGNFEVIECLDETATGAHLKSELEALFSSDSNTSNTALFYFAGQASRADPSATSDTFLIPIDVNDKAIEYTAISIRWLYELLQNSPVKQQIVLLDTNHTGLLTDLMQANAAHQSVGQGRCLATACRYSEFAYEMPDREQLKKGVNTTRRGIFTKVLLEALDAAKQPNGLVTNYRLADSIPEKLMKFPQHPTIYNSGPAIVLTYTSEAVEAAKAMVAASQYEFLAQSPLNDLAEGKDLLNIENEVYALAEVLMMRDLEPPIAVGILGGWGSGKSHIMHLMQQRMTEIRSQPINEAQAWGNLTKDCDTPTQPLPYVGHIYQIKFDAWTYVRSNLWASLMETIFFELNRQLTLEKQLQAAGVSPLQGGRVWQALNEMNDEERQTLLEHTLEPKELAQWQTIASQQQIEDHLLENLKKSNQKKLEVLQTTEAALQEEKNKLQQTRETLRLETEAEIPKDSAIPALSPVASILQTAMGTALDELQDKVKAAIPAERQLEPQEQAHLQAIFDDFRANKLLTWAGLKKWLTANWKLIGGFCLFALLTILIPLVISRLTTQLIPQIVATLLPFIPTVAAAITLLKKFLGWYTEVENSFKAYRNQVEQAQQHLIRRQAERQAQVEKKLEEKLSQSETAQAIETNIKQLTAQVEQRRQSVSVVNHLSLADFVTAQIKTGQYDKRLGLLQQVKTDLAELTERLTLPKQQGKRFEEKIKLLKELFPRGAARVVLYIDDLDRCPPDRVVEVLEAVQLLVKTRLFVVILAIDERYIARALEKVYAGVLSRKGKPSGLDYIEKIIQIPYRVRPIAPTALKPYLAAQMQLEAEDLEPVESSRPSPLPDAELEAEEREQTRGGSSQDISDQPVEEVIRAQPRSLETLPIQVIRFSKEEFETVLECCRHVDLSPRTLKRLINVYKLFKIIWFRSGRLRNVHQNPEIRQAIVAFLALSGRYPNLMRGVFEELEMRYEESRELDKRLIEFFPKQDMSGGGSSYRSDTYISREWNRLYHDLEALKLGELKLDQLGADTFNMVRSFCFVGDIGYDPEDFVSAPSAGHPIQEELLEHNPFSLGSPEMNTDFFEQSAVQPIEQSIEQSIGQQSMAQSAVQSIQSSES